MYAGSKVVQVPRFIPAAARNDLALVRNITQAEIMAASKWADKSLEYDFSHECFEEAPLGQSSIDSLVGGI